jgi:hypothetical protein
MTGAAGEVLVFLAGDEASPSRARIGALAIQQCGARMFVIAGDGPPGVPGAQAIRSGRDLAALKGRLTDAETLFARAWLARRRGKGHREGDALPWDSEGYEAP